MLRAVYPEARGPAARPDIHYDYGVSGVQDMLTSWIPLMDIPVRIGGLAVQPGGHLGRRPPRPLSETEPGWATTSYEPGDAIIFHCLTPHAALPNRGSALRISGDFRWQRVGQPAPAEVILGPAAQPPELFSRLFRREPWWEPVPAGLTLYPRAQLVASRRDLAAGPCPPRLAALAAAPGSALTRSAQGRGAFSLVHCGVLGDQPCIRVPNVRVTPSRAAPTTGANMAGTRSSALSRSIVPSGRSSRLWSCTERTIRGWPDTTKVPSMYEMEGTSPGPGGLAGCPVIWRRGPPPGPDIRANHRVSRRLPRPEVTSGWCPFPTVKALLLPYWEARKVPRQFISGFFAVHISSTEDGWLSAYDSNCPPVYAQSVHRFRG